MALKVQSLSITCLCLCLASFWLDMVAVDGKKVGFSVELIHRDSPKSPLYNPAETPSQRTRKTLRTSSIHAHAVHPDSVESDISLTSFSYVMNISLGTPPTPIVAVADTGSDIIWTQCQPCQACFNQNYPLFRPAASSSYKNIGCSTSVCTNLRDSTCSNSGCIYRISYGDQSHSIGNLAAETLTLGSTDNNPVSFPKTVFGCGHDNAGTFNPGMSGIVGLGFGGLSLVSQLESSIDGKFSYCLIPTGSSGSSKLNFGSAAVVSGDGVVTTPLSIQSPQPFYYVTIESFTVGDKEVPFGSSESGSEGNIILDSGTTLTYLPGEVSSQVQEAIAQGIDAGRVTDPQGFFDYCFQGTAELKVPDVTVNFVGAKVKLEGRHLLVATEDGVVCLTFKESSDVSIFGNLQQQNYLIGYDITAKTVSFKPTDCTQH